MSKAPRGPAKGFDHSQLGLSQADLKTILKCEERVRALGRRTTEGAFELGEQLAIVAPMVPEGTFGKWAVWISGYSREHAYTFITMATVLKPYRARLIQAGVRKKVMDELVKSPQHVEAVLTKFEAGRRLTGNQVKGIIGDDQKATEIPLPFRGGISGLRANAKAKQAMMVSEFAGNITSIIDDIEKALEPVQQGKRVLKGHLAEKIEHRARLTRFQLENIALPVELNPANASQARVQPFPEGSKWREVTELLWTLGGRASWPPEELAPWLSGTVLPTLVWAVDNRKKVDEQDGTDTGTYPLGV